MIEGRIYRKLRRLIELRKENPAFAGGETEVIDTGNPHVFGYVRHDDGQRVLVLASFTEQEQRIAANELRLHGLSYTFTDLVTDEQITPDEELILGP